MRWATISSNNLTHFATYSEGDLVFEILLHRIEYERGASEWISGNREFAIEAPHLPHLQDHIVHHMLRASSETCFRCVPESAQNASRRFSNALDGFASHSGRLIKPIGSISPFPLAAPFRILSLPLPSARFTVSQGASSPF
jgi:hypothetical protein